VFFDSFEKDHPVTDLAFGRGPKGRAWSEL